MRGATQLSAFVALFLAQESPALAERILVRDQAAFRAATRTLAPGDEIVLANGEWRDFQILFEARGTAAAPVALRAETAGQVILTGQSNLRLSGEHLLVSGLVFRDGHSPTDEVIAFRRDSRRVASYSRVTEVVIDGFSPPDRRREDRWVSIYGQDNRVDHSWFAGKTNAGVTLAVIRPAGQPQPNRHRIDHNYFGPRPPLGSNGGETIRIGTSEESLSDSNTIVENNYFDRCDGEVEIVSVKSGGNIIRGNVFAESQGALVLRHGNGNLVERNVFLGRDRPNTGGIRVINRDQVVRNNYLEGLAGTSFASAITVMNGVPNSAINRYHQVSGARIEGNSIIAVRRITLAAGADAERSAPPVDSLFSRNLITGAGDADPFRIEGDIGGITFAGNVLSADAAPAIAEGIALRPVALTRAANGLLYPAEDGIGAPRDLSPVAREATGPTWYPKPDLSAGSETGAAVEVPAGTSLAEAIARGGERFRLAAGIHEVAAPIAVDGPLSISGADDAKITFRGDTLFKLMAGGELRLADLAISGAHAPRQSGNAVFRAVPGGRSGNYALELANVRIDGLTAPGFDVVATSPATLGQRLIIRASRFETVSGTVVAAHSETGSEGHYNFEAIEIDASEFRDVGRVADVFRGGRDESTFGPRFSLTRSTIARAGGRDHSSLLLSGVQETRILENRLEDSGPIQVTHSVGSPSTLIARNQFVRTPMPEVAELYWRGAPRAVVEHNITGDGR